MPRLFAARTLLGSADQGNRREGERHGTAFGPAARGRAHGGRAREAPGSRGPGRVVELRLVNGFEVLVEGEPVELPLTRSASSRSSRCRSGRCSAAYVAAKLWLDTARSVPGQPALRRLAREADAGRDHPDAGHAARARSGGQVDLAAALELARVLLGDEAEVDVPARRLAALQGEILPDWYDDWLTMERETHRQLRLHALEALACGWRGGPLRRGDRGGDGGDRGRAAARERPPHALPRATSPRATRPRRCAMPALYRDLLATQLGLSAVAAVRAAARGSDAGLTVG